MTFTRMLLPRTLVLLAAACGAAACGAAEDDPDNASEGSGTTTASSVTGVTGLSATAAVDDSSGGPSTTVSTSVSSTDPTADGTAEGTSDDTADDTTGGGTLSPGCGNQAAATGESMRSMMIQGVDRTFIVDAPAAIDPDAPLALVFVFHGNGGTGQGIQSMGLQNVPGAQDQAVFVFPDGLQYMDFGVGWNGTCGEYDMEFFDQMRATLADEYCLDPGRIFAAGFSWGGDMCESLACCRGDVVRAIAPASGPEFYPFDCLDTERPAVRMTYATNDAYPPEMFAQTLEFYRTEHGCSDTQVPVEPAPCITFEGCAEPLVSCEYEGLGHAWPADWADQTWAFFSQF